MENAVPLARLLGWGSLGFAAASLVAPDFVARASGWGSRPRLSQAVGVRDLVVGAGLVASADPLPWMRARMVSEFTDVVLMVEGVRRGEFDPRRSLPGAAFALFCLAVEVAIIRELGDRGTSD